MRYVQIQDGDETKYLQLEDGQQAISFVEAENGETYTTTTTDDSQPTQTIIMVKDLNEALGASENEMVVAQPI